MMRINARQKYRTINSIILAIVRSVMTGRRLVIPNERYKDSVTNIAKELNIEIQEPITYDELGK